MIENWLIEDIKKTFKRGCNRFVISDPCGEAAYLLDCLPQDWKQYTANDAMGELHIKYLVEKEAPSQPVVFYTRIPLEKLSFLLEYAMIDGHLDLAEFHQYIKKKVHDHIGLNLNIDKEELLTAAKVSVGKGKPFWMDLSHKGAGQIFELKTMMLEFLHDPNAYTAQMDKQVEAAFLAEVQKHIGQEPIDKPATTIAKEVVNHLLTGFLRNQVDETLLKVYYQWLDSYTYKYSLLNYIENFKLPFTRSIWSFHPDHPFKKIDLKQLQEVVENLHDQNYLDTHRPFLEARMKNKCARLIGVTWWKELLTLIHFDASGIKTIASFQDAISYYTQSFFKLDRAIRKLYAEFLNTPALLRPIQQQYEALLNDLLSKWFEHFGAYEQNQTGKIKSIIESHKAKTAIVVGDGISFEIAKEVHEQIGKRLKVTEDITLADLPAVTDNNMSRMYLADGSFSESKSEREQKLDKEISDKNLKHVYLEDINQSLSEYDVVVCSYKDIDDLGDKMQLKALKYFDTIVSTLAEKILELEKLGFHSIYLISDHGFVLTGLLEESDKLEFTPKGKYLKDERFIACSEIQIAPDQLLQISKDYQNYDTLILSKNLRPFKTPGKYGYSHGGASPQEIITPCFRFESEKSTHQLEAFISNKSEIREIEGQNYEVHVKADPASGDLFSAERKCQLLVYSGSNELASSDVFTIQSGKKYQREFSFGTHKEVQLYLIDAKSKEQLDKAIAKQASGRDLGGLL